MSPLQLNLVVLRVADIEISARFYEALGISFTPEQHGKGPRHLSGHAGRVLLEIYPAVDGLTTRALRLGFSIPSMDKALANITPAGGSVLSEPKASEWGVRAVVVDPDGHKIELIESC